MYFELEGSLVRIFSSTDLHDTKSVVGAGFLVSSDAVLTCAHVVTSALNLPDETSEMPTDAISLDFPIVKANKLLTAHACFWQPVAPNGSGDICVLKLESAPPDGVKEARLVVAEKLWGHQFGAIGFPDYYHRDGISISGELRTRQATGWVQIEGIRAQGFQVQQGFSGGAVWDEQLDGIVGMVVAAETDPTSKVGYMIPADVLINAYLPLREQAIPACPYRGLFAFREEDAAYFFGRETFTQQLADTIRRKTLVAVVGSSGSGKSSVVFAGLLPRLRKEGSWQIATCRPGDDPFHSLAAALIPLLEPHMSGTDRLIEINKLARRLQQGELVFEDVVELIVQSHAAARLLLVVDQFEELYTECKDARERQRFLDLLLAAVEATTHWSRRNFNLVLTLRADFLEQALTYRPLNDALQLADLKLGPMNRAELEDAIRKPAEKLQVRLADGLVQRILDDVGQEAGNLPLLEFALTLLWSKQHERTLTHAAYDEIGGIEMALADHAEAKFLEFNEEEQIQVGNIFRRLVHPGEGTGDTRRIATRTEIGEENWPLVAWLANERLVITSRDKATEQEMVEVIHEALIRRWQRFRDWIEEDRQFLTWRDQLQAALRRWKNSGNDEGALLRGRLLGEAQDWKIQRPAALTEDEQTFIQASQQSEQANLQRERERADHLQKLLEEAEQHRREAEVQREEAKRQQQIALARSLAAQAELLRNQYPYLLERSVLLAIESLRRFPSPEAHQTLENATMLLRSRTFSTTVHEVRKWLPMSWSIVSTDGAYVATLNSEGRVIQVWNVIHGRLLASFHHQGEASLDLSQFSPKGDFLTIWAYDRNDSSSGTMEVWDVAKGCPLDWLTHFSTLKNVEFSPHEKCLAASSADETVKLWDVATGQLLLELDYQSPAAFSPDERQLATTSTDMTVAIWDIVSGQKLFTFQHHSNIIGATYSPDGLYLATINAERRVSVWDVVNNHVCAFFDHQDEVLAVRFSPDGKYLATESKDYTIWLWEVSNDSPLAASSNTKVEEFIPSQKTLTPVFRDKSKALWKVNDKYQLMQLSYEQEVLSIAFSSDGGLFTVANGNRAEIWETVTGHRLATFEHQGKVISVAFSSNNSYLATASSDKTAGIWEIATGRRLACLAHSEGIFDVKFSANGTLLTTIGRDGINVWEVFSRPLQFTLPTASKLMIFSPDGRFLVTTKSLIARLWEVASGRQVSWWTEQKGGDAAVFSPDGKYMAVVGADRDIPISKSNPHPKGFIKVWDLNSGQLLFMHERDRHVKAAIFSPDGNYLATVITSSKLGLVFANMEYLEEYYAHRSDQKEAGMVEVWEMTGGHVLHSLNHDAEVDRVQFSADGSLLIAVDENQAIKVWNASDGKRITEIGSDDSVELSLDGSYAATYERYGDKAQLWELAHGEVRHSVSHEHIESAVFSPDGRYLATLSSSNVIVWDVTTGNQLASLTHEAKMVAFSQDGNCLVTAGYKAARLWKTSGYLLNSLTHDENVNTAVFSPDGRYLATASRDRTVRIWEFDTGQQQAAFLHEEPLETVVFSPDGKYLASVGEHAVKIWLWRPEDLIAEAQHRLTRNLTEEEWQQYLGDEPYRKTCQNLP